MNWFFIALAVVIGIVAGFCVIKAGAAQTTLKIEFHYSSWNWVFVILMALLFVLAAFILDLFFSIWIYGIIEEQNIYLYLLKKFVENGLSIPLLSAVISWLFCKQVEAYHLQYSRFYSPKVSKICFSVLVVSFCILLYVAIKPESWKEDENAVILINRILMWLITVVGTWIGFGFACEGSIAKDNKLIRDIDDKVLWKEKLFFWLPIVCALMLCVLILVLAIKKDIATKIAIIVSAFGFGFFASAFIGIYFSLRKVNPWERRSERIFKKAKKNLEKGLPAQGQYGKVEYELFKKELKIKPRAVIYEGHEGDDDFKNLFGGTTISFEKYSDALIILKEMNENQKDYIKKGFDNCIKEARKKMLEEIK